MFVFVEFNTKINMVICVSVRQSKVTKAIVNRLYVT